MSEFRSIHVESVTRLLDIQNPGSQNMTHYGKLMLKQNSKVFNSFINDMQAPT